MNTPEDRLITIITAVRDGEDCLSRCIDSVLAQDYPHIEHIVMDGGSTDGTLSILKHYEDKLAFWSSAPDDGVFDAWNKGLLLARGEWIGFLGADDVYLPGAISAYVALARDHPQAEFLCSTARLEHPTGYSPVFGGPWEWPKFARAMSTIHVGTLHHRSLFARLGNFNKEFRIAGDYELMLRAKSGLRTAFTSHTTVVMRAGGLSDSTAGLHEAKRAKLLHGVRSKLAAEWDLLRLVARFYVRKLFIAVRARLVQQHEVA